jgi:anthranilate/para-aminobenzoate synthase component I
MHDDRIEFLARRPLVLAPTDARGWFRGDSMFCIDPVSEFSCTCAEAAAVLEEVFEGSDERIAAAVVAYDGSAVVRTYREATAVGGYATPWEVLIGADSVSAHHGADLLLRPVFGSDREQYVLAVRRVQQAIERGDVYVANLTYRISGEAACDPVTAFSTLMGRSGSRMSALVGDSADSLVSVSPERFMSIRLSADGSRHAAIQPIKGTRPRGDDLESDMVWTQKLRDSEKERAEHVMIVDMERNDLGRVSVPGTVRVEPLCTVFPTPYCHQMESTVHGILTPEVSLADVLDSVFPCGSITGAPKRAAMRFIRELEHEPRGAYTGALLVARSGHLDSSVLIRTMEYDGQRAVWGTGGGITIDSDPVAEWDESLLKASPVLSDNMPLAQADTVRAG